MTFAMIGWNSAWNVLSSVPFCKHSTAHSDAAAVGVLHQGEVFAHCYRNSTHSNSARSTAACRLGGFISPLCFPLFCLVFAKQEALHNWLGFGQAQDQLQLAAGAMRSAVLQTGTDDNAQVHASCRSGAMMRSP
jgi:hypothetical protein